MRLGRCSRAFVKPRTAVANLMTSAKTLSASIRSSVIGHHLPSSGRPCPARKVPPGTRLLSHSGANVGQQPTPLPSINPAELELGGVFLCRHARRQNGGRACAPKVLALGAKPRRGARLGRARVRRPGSTTVRRCPRVSLRGGDAGRGFPRAPHGGKERSGRTRQRVRERRSPPQAPVLREREVLRD